MKNIDEDEWDQIFDEDFDDEDNKKIAKTFLHRQVSLKSLLPVTGFILLSLFLSYLFWTGEFSQYFLVSRKSIYYDGEYWRLFTAILVHSNVGHFLSNIPLLLIFGWFLFDFFGFIAFPILPIILGILTNLITISFYPLYTNLLGSSGLSHSMVSMWIFCYFYYDDSKPRKEKALRVFGFLLVMMIPSTMYKNTSYLSHLAGFILGFLGAFFLIYFGIRRQECDRCDLEN